MLDVIKSTSKTNGLGRLGENEHKRMLFDISEYASMYSGATYTLLNQLPGSLAAYPVANTAVDGNTLYWSVGSEDLSSEGHVKCELIVMQGDVIAKSVIYMTRILPALDGSGDAPDPWQGILDELNGIKEDAQEAAQSAANSASAAADSARQAAQRSMGVRVENTNLIFENIVTGG